MKPHFEIEVAGWMSALPPYDDPTVAQLGIRVYDSLVTDVADRESRSISDVLRVSAKTLAGWLVHNYWRLTSESSPRRHDVDWLLAHNMASAGNGYSWPKLFISCDGEIVRINDRSSEEDRYADVRFIGAPRLHFLTLDVFKQEVFRFVDLVVRRLRETSPNDPLIGAWDDFAAEYSQPGSAAYRRLEAKLGYGVDEAPEAEVLGWDRAASNLGDAAVDELLAARTTLEEAMRLRDAARTASATINVEGLRSLAGETRESFGEMPTPAWQPAVRMAARLRQELGLSGPIGSDVFAALFGYRDDEVVPIPGERAAGWDDGSTIRVAARRNNSVGARFEASRIIGDYMAFGQESFRPVLDTYSWRQQFQRSFGQAFLAPIDLVRQRRPKGRDWTRRDIEGAAEYFQVSSWMIGNALRNNGDISHASRIDREIGLMETV